MRFYFFFLVSFFSIFLSLPMFNYAVDWYGFFQTPKNGIIRSLRNITNTNTQFNTPIIRTKSGASLEEHLQTLKAIVNAGPIPEKVIIGIDDFILSSLPEVRNKFNVSFSLKLERI